MRKKRQEQAKRQKKKQTKRRKGDEKRGERKMAYKMNSVEVHCCEEVPDY